MTYRDFLDATYTFFVERFRDMSPDISLDEALAMADGWQAGAKKEDNVGGNEKASEMSEARRRRREEQEMAEFDEMMRGTVPRRV